jgi:hypothetical protein
MFHNLVEQSSPAVANMEDEVGSMEIELIEDVCAEKEAVWWADNGAAG